MRGYPFAGEPDNRKVGRLIVNGVDVAEIGVITAATGEHDRVLIVPKKTLVKVPALADFYKQTEGSFPDGGENGIVFDGVHHTFGRHDFPTDQIIFHPTVPVQAGKKTEIDVGSDHDVARMEGEGGVQRVNPNEDGGVNYPTGGDQPQVAQIGKDRQPGD